MTLVEKKIETLCQLPQRNFMLYQNGKPREANLLKQKCGEEEMDFVLFPLPYPLARGAQN